MTPFPAGRLAEWRLSNKPYEGSSMGTTPSRKSKIRSF